MTEPFPTPTTTPKRKRDEQLPVSPIYPTPNFSFQLPDAKSEEDGSGSPHSKVVHKFRGLALNGGGGGVAQQQNREGPYDPTREDRQDGYNDDPFASRKRAKVPELEMKDAEADAAEPVVIPDPEIKSDPAPVAKSKSVTIGPDAATEEILQPVAMTTTATGLQHPHRSIDRLQDPKSQGRRRAGTPPLKGRKGKVAETQDEDQEMKIVDPVRAALTWKEEEITIYDPEDEDDDGTGINGVGFMPTAAMAYARTQKRRLQLAEYKKREESEARARRSQRRRGSGGGLSSKLDSKPSGSGGGGVRKVRFTEAEPNPVVTNV
ncbi:hypothetical protein ColTof4_11771 [Colletotrichum tofieldiae]|uniref:Uncharacterized protein n=1 Tax=Colletotrichum tofieldiae TaxID=708197 RepID=A0A161VYN7_9PEZI|nr:hypothetical protein CT0861_11433 [Colletotrichum tofieldiae]GKT55815.1 hypothetical protein ColTof3_03154 [Colletotrichum tofieldiae]GKT79348.1 hypothetical protein ColTof4_11771 [Colletotrichum tofieldiae]